METIELIILCVLFMEISYLVLASKGKNTMKQAKKIFIDTSALIDGRIISVCEAGFMGDSIDVPRSVIAELQYMADKADSDKRSKARQGLDNIKKLQSIDGLIVNIFDDNEATSPDVDDKLLYLAKKYHGSICTLDYNLNKVARVDGIQILNINDLAMNLRMAYLPGEKIKLLLGQKGQERNQALGHLDDGTMVVVENASKQIGQVSEVEIIRGLQTSAGKMMFARLVSQSNESKAPKKIQHNNFKKRINKSNQDKNRK